MSNKSFALATGAVAAALVIGTGAAQAADVTYDFSFTLPTSINAPAAGASGSGSFTFDEALVNTGLPFQTIALPEGRFSFDLLGQTFTPAAGRGESAVNYFGGVFSGVFFDLDVPPADFPLFGLTLNQFEVSLFDLSFNPGSAPISYTRRAVEPPTNVIPTPALLPGLVGLGLAAVRKRKEAQAV